MFWKHVSDKICDNVGLPKIKLEARSNLGTRSHIMGNKIIFMSMDDIEAENDCAYPQSHKWLYKLNTMYHALFVLCHELGHYLMDYKYPDWKRSDEREEIFADRIAFGILKRLFSTEYTYIMKGYLEAKCPYSVKEKTEC